MFKAIAASWLLLFLGDLFSTFCYHVPEHVFGRLHVRIHHSPRKNFRHYAVLSPSPLVLLDGLLGALPYLALAVVLWPLSPAGVVAGLLVGQFHVWWRHTTALGWQTPGLVARLCSLLGVTTPEQHWLHHSNPNQAFGDIFYVFDRLARRWMIFLRRWRRSLQPSL